MGQTQSARQKNDFSQGKVSGAILRMAIPLAIAQLVNVLYNLVDRMYIGHLSDSMAFTGLGLSLPVVMLVGAFSNLYGTGAAPFCSIERGRGDLDKAARIQGNAFTLLLITGAVLTLLGLIFTKPILYALGASDATYPYAASYLRIYLMGTVFVLISHGMNSLINAQGYAHIGMLTVVIGAVLNLILDPIFIFKLNLGVKGAAIATVISQGCSAAWALVFLCSRKVNLRLTLRAMKLSGEIVKKIFSLGVTGFCMSATTALVSAVANTQLRNFGGDLYIGVMTALTSVHEVVFMVISGITQGAQPVLGYNYGAEKYERVIAGIRFITLVCIGYSFLVWVCIMLLPGPIIRLFNSDAQLVSAGISASRIYFMTFVFMSLQASGQSTFVGLGRAKQAVFFSLLRKVGLVVSLTLLLPRLWNLGVNGVFLAEPISNVIGGVACYLTMYFTVVKKLRAKTLAKTASPVGEDG